MTPARRPPLLTDVGAAVLALVLVALAGRLGLWQYDAWQAHRTSEARDLTQLDPVALDDVMGSDDPFPAPDIGRPVEVDGRWLDGGFWVADRSYGGRDGYWAVNPMQVGDAGILVVRGWAPEPDPALLAVDGSQDVVGWLQPPDGSLAVDDDPTDDVFPEIRVADAVQRVDIDLFSAYLVDRVAAPGLEQAELSALPEPGTFTGVRNLLYAFEWWIFGGFAAFIWWRWRRDATQAPAGPLDDPAAPDETPVTADAARADRAGVDQPVDG